MAACTLTIFIKMIIIKFIYDIHNLNTKLCSGIRMTKSVILTLFSHKDIDRIRKTDKSKHSGEAVPMNKPLFCKEIRFKKARLLYLKRNTCIHIFCHDIHNIRKLVVFKIFNSCRALGNMSQNQTAERVSTTTKQQAIITACNDVILTQFIFEHPVICKTRLGCLKRTLDTGKCKIIICNLRVILH